MFNSGKAFDFMLWFWQLIGSPQLNQENSGNKFLKRLNQIFFRMFVVYFIEFHIVISFTINFYLMKYVVTLLTMFLFAGIHVFGQVAINTNGSLPDNSALLENARLATEI